MLTRLIDYLKSKQITTMFTNLTHERMEATESEVSSVMDTWLLLKDIEIGGERNRGIYILKSRGMPHSNQVREFLITSKGVEIIDVYTGSQGVLTGSARVAQEEKEKADQELREEEVDRLAHDLERRHKIMEAQVAAVTAEYEVKAEEIKQQLKHAKERESSFEQNRARMSKARGADEKTLKDKKPS
jgi:circadian clock protein KaiC